MNFHTLVSRQLNNERKTGIERKLRALFNICRYEIIHLNLAAACSWSRVSPRTTRLSNYSLYMCATAQHGYVSHCTSIVSTLFCFVFLVVPTRLLFSCRNTVIYFSFTVTWVQTLDLITAVLTRKTHGYSNDFPFHFTLPSTQLPR